VADEILRGGAVEASCWRMNVFLRVGPMNMIVYYALWEAIC
jgi:hypothetical protein